MKEERDMERVITSAVKYCTECEKICSNDIIILLGIENELNITMDAGEGMILTEDEIIVIQKHLFQFGQRSRYMQNLRSPSESSENYFQTKSIVFYVIQQIQKMIILQYYENI